MPHWVWTVSVFNSLKPTISCVGYSALAFTAPGHWLPWGRLPDAVRQGGTQARAVLGADAFEYLAGQPAEERWFAAAMASATGSRAASMTSVAGRDLGHRPAARCEWLRQARPAPV